MGSTARTLGAAAAVIVGSGALLGCDGSRAQYAIQDAMRAALTDPEAEAAKARAKDAERAREAEAQRQQRIDGADRERRQAEWKAKPHIAIARALPIFEGAVVCETFARVQLVYDLQARWWQDAMQDKLTRGQSRLIRDPMPKPNVAALGCVMVPAGEEMIVHMGGHVPAVTVTRNGVSFQGTTLAAMFVIRDNI